MKKYLSLVLIFWTFYPGFTQSSDDLSVSYQQALDLINAYKFDEAQELLSECYIKDQENLDYLLKIGYCNFQTGRYRDARLFFNKSLNVDSLNTTALSSLGSIFEREANYRRAREYYVRLIDIDSTNAFYFKRLAYVDLRLRRPIGAIYQFLKAHSLNPNDIEAIEQLSALYLRADQLDFAEEMLGKGLQLAPDNIKLLQNQARLFHKRKNYPEVIQSIEHMLVQGDTTDYYQLMIGVSYLQVDSVDHALHHLEALEKRGEKSEHLFHYLGLAYRDKNQPEKAVTYLDLAIQEAVSPKMHLYLADLAQLREEQGNHKKAIELYQQAFEEKEEPEYLFRLARNTDIYYKDKKIAIRYYQQYLATEDRKFRNYATERITHLKELVHFGG
jgi:tetratricopeptide (TPR) repeat protein